MRDASKIAWDIIALLGIPSHKTSYAHTHLVAALDGYAREAIAEDRARRKTMTPREIALGAYRRGLTAKEPG